MQRAVDDFLLATGAPPSETRGAAGRVAKAWAGEFLKGYRMSASEALAERFPVANSAKGELVMVCGLTFRSTCPHHLLPYEGRMHVAYLPRDEIVGFGAVARVVETYALRLILQETLAREVAEALTRELNCLGAACLIEAKQQCLRLRGTRQHAAVTVSEYCTGKLRGKSQRAELWAKAREATSVGDGA